MIGDDGRVSLNVAIRTAMVEPVGEPGDPESSQRWLASYSVGAGIVADSDPACEWQETLHKARAFLGLSRSEGEGMSGYVIQSSETREK